MRKHPPDKRTLAALRAVLRQHTWSDPHDDVLQSIATRQMGARLRDDGRLVWKRPYFPY